MTNKKYPALDALPEDFDPLDLAAFLDGEDNSALAASLETSAALQSVAAVSLTKQAPLADAASIERLVTRAQGLAKRSGEVATQSFLDRVMRWFGADMRATAAAFGVAVVAFGAGLSGGIGLGGTGLDADEVLVSAAVSDVFALDATSDFTTLIETDAFDSVFGSIQ